MLLSDYLKIGGRFDKNGIFDPALDEDSHFFINLQRLKRTTVPEFQASYASIQNYFKRIINFWIKLKRKMLLISSIDKQ